MIMDLIEEQLVSVSMALWKWILPTNLILFCNGIRLSVAKVAVQM